MKTGAPRLRTVVALLFGGLLVWLAFLWVDIRADPESVFGETSDGLQMGELQSARLAVAVLSPDSSERIAIARNIAAILEADPTIATINSGPVAPSGDVLDWLWRNRFRLAPPTESAMSEEAMAKTLTEARAELATMRGTAFGDYLLRDPTGSFTAILQHLEASAPSLNHEGGVWRSTDGRAALVFSELASPNPDRAAVLALDARVREAGANTGANVLMVGPALISAKVADATEREAMLVCGVAVVLLIIWLLWVFRGIAGVGAMLTPLAVAAPLAVLVVDAVFGSIHAIAIGFGSALVGLALDYPMHLAGHGGEQRSSARRGVAIGALTTAIAFLGMLGAGVPALQEVGVFVATGLLAAAGASMLLIPSDQPPIHALKAERCFRSIPGRRVLEASVIVAGIVAAIVGGSREQRSLADIPQEVRQTIQSFIALNDGMSERYMIVSEGQDVQATLIAERAILPRLEAARAVGEISNFFAVSTLLPPLREQTSAAATLPSPNAFSDAAKAALAHAGMAPGFLPKINEAFQNAVDAAPIEPGDFADAGFAALVDSQIVASEYGARSFVRLTGVAAPEALAARIASSAPDGVRLVDVKRVIEGRLATLRRHAVLWLGAGALGAIGALFLFAPNVAAAFRITWTTAAALGSTVTLLTLTGADYNIFQIVALALVLGITVDYAVFLQLAEDYVSRVAAARSVALCAVSTFIAFVCMAFAENRILHEIGVTVLIGLTMSLVHNFFRSGIKQ